MQQFFIMNHEYYDDLRNYIYHSNIFTYRSHNSLFSFLHQESINKIMQIFPLSIYPSEEIIFFKKNLL